MNQVTEINPADYAKYWWLTLIIGILLVALGVFMFSNSDGTVAFMVTLLGIVWLVSGGIEIAEALLAHRRKRRILSVVVGIFSIVLGLCALSENLSLLLGHANWITGIALAVLFMGLLQIVQARKGLRRTMILGILNVIIGAGLLFFPDALGGILLFVIAGLILVAGAVLIWYSFWLRRQDEPAPAAERLNH
ncbi:MAG: hypothetical protein HDKAJFGB_03433 [Anaerolineae bacterium]|nr:hypothetical protein [Anaerolineae bacterium]